jgi:hypothetical protein
MSLLDIARKEHTRIHNEPITDEDVDLALAWIKGEIGIAGVNAAYQGRGRNHYARLARALRKAFEQRRLIIFISPGGRP